MSKTVDKPAKPGSTLLWRGAQKILRQLQCPQPSATMLRAAVDDINRGIALYTNESERTVEVFVVLASRFVLYGTGTEVEEITPVGLCSTKEDADAYISKLSETKSLVDQYAGLTYTIKPMRLEP